MVRLKKRERIPDTVRLKRERIPDTSEMRSAQKPFGIWAVMKKQSNRRMKVSADLFLMNQVYLINMNRI